MVYYQQDRRDSDMFYVHVDDSAMTVAINIVCHSTCHNAGNRINRDRKKVRGSCSEPYQVRTIVLRE